jgi:anaerobic magnesium-protoporphyrin IX monomethyl ester cyclase
VKIYLLNPPYLPHFSREMRWQNTGRGGTLYYPIWLSYASSALEHHGQQVRLVDAPAREWNVEKVIDDVLLYSPDLLVMGTSFTSLDNDLKIARLVKDKLNKLIVMVGPPTSQFASRILDGGVDVVARNEYDFTLVDLVSNIESGTSYLELPGISYKEGSNFRHNPDRTLSTSQMLDTIPFVSEVYKKHLNIRDYFLSYSLYPMVQIFGGRGCPFECSFCSWPQSFSGKRYRVRSVSNILDEMKWIEDNLSDVKEVFIEDDTFTLDRVRVKEFCDSYVARGLRMNWSCNARVGTLDFDLMKGMKRANCRFVIVGFESANDEILIKIKKRINVEESGRFAKDVKRSGLFLHADFILGLPGETIKTIGNTWRFIKEIKPDQLQVSVASPFPGTEFYQWAKEEGHLVTDDPNAYLDSRGNQKSVISYPHLTSEQIEKEVDKILKSYYLSLAYVPVAIHQIRNRNGWAEFKRMWHSARIFGEYIFHK